ncbi:MAG: hypothetical protein A3E78_10395 [Alphaproteobacteria bacterium RIFCSPHIGHO2_12_FULL_63_12]|nr:MAG: hypothetical protein A3E78_10395 [Alphaproteobacteria bacterium RIFCSPHIGHO2_12_FULL_63_12]
MVLKTSATTAAKTAELARDRLADIAALLASPATLPAAVPVVTPSPARRRPVPTVRPPTDVAAVVVVDKDAGVVDAMCVDVRFLLVEPARLVRVMRSEDRAGVDPPSLSVYGADALRSLRGSSRSKGVEAQVKHETALRVDAVAASVVDNVALDPTTGLRVSRDIDQAVDPSRLGDRSVEDDPATLRRGRLARDVDRGERSGPTSFVEIASFSPGRAVGRHSVRDKTVMFGRRYRYFVAVESSIGQVRSRVVHVDTFPLDPPATPEVHVRHDRGRVSVSISSPVGKIPEKYEVFRRVDAVGSSAPPPIGALSLGGRPGFILERVDADSAAGFALVGEALAASSANGGGTIYDHRAPQGSALTYRVYAVDSFGNKSPTPADVSVEIPEDGRIRSRRVVRPTIDAELDGNSKNIRITARANDPRASAVVVERRDITAGGPRFASPASPSWTTFGSRSPFSLDRDPRLFSEVDGWVGFLQTTSPSASLVLDDRVVAVDHVYQYRAKTIDRVGCESWSSFSRPVFVHRDPIVDAPVGLSAVLEVGLSGSATVVVSWAAGTLNIDPYEMVGSREKLTDTAVRSLYQVERRRPTEEVWAEFPLQDATVLHDVVGDHRPQHVPPAPTLGATYLYRVVGMQSGGLVSNRTQPVEIVVERPVLRPIDVRTVIRSDGTVVLNWNTPVDSEIVDGWEVERDDGSGFTSIASVGREASRSRSLSLELRGQRRPSSEFTGQHWLVDRPPTGSSKWRIRARTRVGTRSGWVETGVAVVG